MKMLLFVLFFVFSAFGMEMDEPCTRIEAHAEKMLVQNFCETETIFTGDRMDVDMFILPAGCVSVQRFLATGEWSVYTDPDCDTIFINTAKAKGS